MVEFIKSSMVVKFQYINMSYCGTIDVRSLLVIDSTRGIKGYLRDGFPGNTSDRVLAGIVL